MITVKDLQELLSTYHPDDVVILSSDPEGIVSHHLQR